MASSTPRLKNSLALRVRRGFELTVPETIRPQVAPGDFFRAELVRGTLVLRPTDAFDSSVADTDIAAGRVSGPHRTTASFMRGLKRTSGRAQR